MSLRLKNTESIQGNTLPVVLLFATMGMITVLTYLFGQVSVSKPSLRSPASLQALLNARSGVYKAFNRLIDTTRTTTDTLKTLSTLDSLFGSELIDPIDTSDNTFGSEPEPLSLFPTDSFGTCEIMMLPQGSFYVIESKGKFNKAERTVKAKLGSKIPALPDTVLLYYNDAPWEGNKPEGTIVSSTNQPPDSATSLLSEMISKYQEHLMVEDTVMFDQPLTIQSQRELDKISDTINGHLIIDGTHFDLDLKGNRTIRVMGDIQLTGKVTVENISFIAGGEIKLFDESHLSGVTLFSNSRIFIGDRASYQGDALACHSISIYGDASVTGKSTIVVSGGSTATSAKDSMQYSILIADNASVDATCMALRTPGSIKTDQNTKITGILWARNIVCHRGRMKGLISALRVIDCDDPGQLAPLTGTAQDSTSGQIAYKNAIPGSLSPLESISEYPMPYFTGSPTIIDWKEF